MPGFIAGLLFKLVIMSVELVKDRAGMKKFVLKEPQGSSAEVFLPA